MEINSRCLDEHWLIGIAAEVLHVTLLPGRPRVGPLYRA